MAKRCRFYLYQRKLKKGKYWYVNFIDPTTGNISTAKSIDVLKEKLGLGYTDTIKRREEAAIIANRALDAGLIYLNNSDITFYDYCTEFWDWDKSQYIKLRNYVKPNSIGQEYAKNMLINFKRHVSVYLPKNLRLREVKTWHLETIINNLFKEGKLAAGTIQLVVISFTQPLKEALRQGLILENPSSNLIRVASRENSRGSLTYSECVLFSKTLNTMYKDGTIFKSYYLALMLALSTGMRSGEIRVLNRSNIISSFLTREDGVVLDKIIISQSIAPYSGIKSTKGKYDRAICIPHEFGTLLIGNSDKKGRIFPGKNGGYISSPTLRLAFSNVLLQMGLDAAEQKMRELSFHSLRHSFSTLSRDNNVSMEDRMLVLGHRSEKVNERYTHMSDEQLERVSTFVGDIVDMFLV